MASFQTDEQRATEIQKQFPNVSYKEILELCKEIRTIEGVVDRLKSPQLWKTAKKKKTVEPPRESARRPKRQGGGKAAGDSKSDDKPPASAPPPKQTLKFRQPGKTPWSNLNLDNPPAAPPSEPIPAPARVGAPPVEEVFEPPPPAAEPARPPPIESSSLFLPKSLQDIVPFQNRFGTFAGPVPRPPPPAPSRVALSDAEEFEVQHPQPPEPPMGFPLPWPAPYYCYPGLLPSMPLPEGEQPRWMLLPPVRPGTASTDGAARPLPIPCPLQFPGSVPPGTFSVQQPEPA
jgi:hypothetical protein